MLSDTLGIKLHTINTTEGGGLGAIILAMVGIHKYKDVKTACKHIIKINQTFTPNMQKHKQHLLQYKKFKAYYKMFKMV
jgi:xylulokinase